MAVLDSNDLVINDTSGRPTSKTLFDANKICPVLPSTVAVLIVTETTQED